MSSVQDERALGLPGESHNSVSGEVTAVAPSKVYVRDRDEDGGNECGGPRRRRR